MIKAKGVPILHLCPQAVRVLCLATPSVSFAASSLPEGAFRAQPDGRCGTAKRARSCDLVQHVTGDFGNLLANRGRLAAAKSLFIRRRRI